ncbi:MAG: ABC-F family ATP-binding cassette domain-containing protein [Deltaproteobacteria bacterium]|nr:ABC-F family ATP-binding cassette domain-containing protein [Deltaproteobacteria bacterium]
MSLLNIINLNLLLSQKEIFKNLNIQVETGDRIGLVGPNGSGKTTLLRIITGEMRPDSGEVTLTGGSRFGYLSQDVGEKLSGQLLQSIIDSVPGRKTAREEIRKIETYLGEGVNETEQIRLAERLTELHHEMANLDTIYPPHRAEKILGGLGFREESFPESVSKLSGGWRMRASLASILYQSPDLLLLDEPTNHLDLPSVMWLEQFLGEFKGAIILVCHDREFLNRQINRVVSFEPEGIRSYRGNYDQYLKAREDENNRLEAMARNQEQKVKDAKKFIERFKTKATKARQAQSKIKLLKKIEIVNTHKIQKSIRFSFPEVSQSSRNVLTIRSLSKSFGEKRLYEDIDLNVFRGERIGLIGPNGYGKTTLLRIIGEELTADSGSISRGHNVEMSYYAQHHSEMLDQRKTILEEVYQVVPHESVSFVRGICGAFLFSGEDVDKPVKVLSGGEKARVSLAKILIKPGNLLIMDEPTNHLDLISSEILIDALDKYSGTLLFVSHNQSFINRLATKIWDIRDGHITEYPGTLKEYYLHLREIEKDGEPETAYRTETAGENFNIQGEKPGESRKEIRRKKAERRKEISAALKPVETKLAGLEEKIAEFETREKEISGQLADPELFKDSSKSVPLLSEYKKVKHKLDDLYAEWEETQIKMEALKQEMGLEED